MGTEWEYLRDLEPTASSSAAPSDSVARHSLWGCSAEETIVHFSGINPQWLYWS